MTKLRRRMFLRGLGGVSLSIPFLASLAPRKLRADYLPPKRFVAISQDHGVTPARWYPAAFERELPSNADYTERDLAHTEGPVSTILGASFDPLKSKLLLFRGLDSALHYPNTNAHMRSTGLCGTLLDGDQPGASLDHVLAASNRVVRPETPIRHVSAGVHGQNHSFELVNGEMRSPYMFDDGQSLFDRFFRGFEQPADQRETQRRRSELLIDSVMEHYQGTVRSPKLGGDDRKILNEFVEGMHAVETRLAGSYNFVEQCGIPSFDFAPYENDDVQAYDRRIRSMMDVISLALKCGVVQIVHFGLPTPEDSRPAPASNYAIFKNLDTGSIRFSLPIHSYSHNDGNWADTRPLFENWLADHVAYFLRSLDVQEHAESTATFLDNSLVAYQNNLSNGSSHLRYDMPVLLAGSLGGALRTGRFVDFSQNVRHTLNNSGNRPVGVDFNRYLVTVLQAFGLEEQHYQQPLQPPGFGSDYRHADLHPALDRTLRRAPLPGILTG